jgi:hypothetical protein
MGMVDLEQTTGPYSNFLGSPRQTLPESLTPRPFSPFFQKSQRALVPHGSPPPVSLLSSTSNSPHTVNQTNDGPRPKPPPPLTSLGFASLRSISLAHPPREPHSLSIRNLPRSRAESLRPRLRLGVGLGLGLRLGSARLKCELPPPRFSGGGDTPKTKPKADGVPVPVPRRWRGRGPRRGSTTRSHRRRVTARDRDRELGFESGAESQGQGVGEGWCARSRCFDA